MRKFTPLYQVNRESQEMTEPLNKKEIHKQIKVFYHQVWRTEIAESYLLYKSNIIFENYLQTNSK